MAALELKSRDECPSLAHSADVGTNEDRRIFKHLCLEQKWTRDVALFVFTHLHAQGQEDLAFYVAFTQGLWDVVAETFGDTAIKKSLRRCALTRAMRQGAWDYVMQMVCGSVNGDTHKKDQCHVRHGVAGPKHGVTSQHDSVAVQSDLRLVFLEAVRQAEWRWAMQLCSQGFSPKYSDIKVALNACIILNHWKHIGQICQFSKSTRHTTRLFKLAIQAVIRHEETETFLQLCDEAKGMCNQKLLKLFLKEAIVADRCDFVIAACQRHQGQEHLHCQSHLQSLAAEMAIELEHWSVVREIVKRLGFGTWFSVYHFVECVGKIFHQHDTWQTCAGFLDAWCQIGDFVLDDILGEARDKLNACYFLCFADWCSEESFYNLALLLSLVSQHWPSVTSIILKHGDTICKEFLSRVVRLAMEMGAWDSTVAILTHLELEDIDEYFLSEFGDPKLIEKCRERGLTNWVVHLAMCTDRWSLVDMVMKTCADTTLIDHTVRHAIKAFEPEWQLIESLLKRCSEDECLLMNVLRSAVDHGNSNCVRILLQRVNPFSGNQHQYQNILYEAVGSCCKPEKVVKLCIQSGLSAFQSSLEYTMFSPIKRALQTRQYPLVCLLYESGSCSNRELNLLRKDVDLRHHLERQNQDEMLQYVDDCASHPRSLQNLCRLTVSRLLGCHPGRRDRITSLGLPLIIQDYLCFEDLF